MCRCSLKNPFHAVVILCAFHRKPEQTCLYQLLQIRHLFQYDKIFFRVCLHVCMNQFRKAGPLQAGFGKVRDRFSIHAAALVSHITDRAVAAFDPTRCALLINTPVKCLHRFCVRVKDRTAEFVVKHLDISVCFLTVRTLRPELSDHKAARIGLHQIQDISPCAQPAHLAEGFELHRSSASEASGNRIVLRLPNRNLAVTVAAIAGFGTAAPVLIEHIILLNADLTDPSVPVLWKRRHKRHCCIPRIGFFLVPGQKLLFPNPFLKLPDRPDRLPFGMQILTDHSRITG